MKAALRGYLKHARWILLVSLILATAMGYYTFQYEPDQYESAVELYVLPSGTDDNAKYNAAASQMLARDCAELLKNPALLYEAEAKLSPDTLTGMSIFLEGVNGTHLIRLKAVGEDPALCQAAVTAVSVVFMEHLRDVANLESAAVAGRAQLAETPVGPRRVLKIVATFAGAFLLGTLLYFLFASKKPVLCLEDAGKSVLGIPVLGGVSDFRQDLATFFKKKGDQTRILCQYVNRSTIEDVKALSLSLGASAQKRRSMVVASYSTYEGKSSLAVLLATELAGQGRRVLLVDMDCYARSLGRLLCVRGQHDLLHYLAGEATLDQVINRTPVPGVFFIDALHEESFTSRMVASPGFLQFMTRMYAEFDVILFDTPPASLFADAAALGSVLDGMLLVVADQRLSKEALEETAGKLEKAGSRIIGLVFSFARPRSQKQYSDYEDQRKHASA